MPSLQVLNKVDLVSEEDVARLTRVFTDASDAVQAVLPCTALDGEGVEAVRGWAARVVPDGPPMYDKVCVRFGGCFKGYLGVGKNGEYNDMWWLWSCACTGHGFLWSFHNPVVCVSMYVCQSHHPRHCSKRTTVHRSWWQTNQSAFLLQK